MASVARRIVEHPAVQAVAHCALMCAVGAAHSRDRRSATARRGRKSHC